MVVRLKAPVLSADVPHVDDLRAWACELMHSRSFREAMALSELDAHFGGVTD